MDEFIAKLWLLAAEVADIWIIVAIVVTLASVQMFKAVLKHYVHGKWDSFTIKIVIFAFAFVAGYLLTVFFVEGAPMVDKWAVAIAFLNPFIYKGILIYATKKKWLGVISVLKMRKLVERGGHEKVIDHDDKTMVIGRRLDD